MIKSLNRKWTVCAMMIFLCLTVVACEKQTVAESIEAAETESMDNTLSFSSEKATETEVDIQRI